jgi:hypothetical protein
VETARGGGVVLPHVLCYELCRNYIFPEEFTAALDFCLLEGPDCWGWANQGFVNVLGTLLLDELHDPAIGFTYHGHTRDAFLASMEDELKTYISRGGPFAETFLHERLPWKPASSVDNVWSGLLVRLWRDHGRGAFLARFFAAIPALAATRAPASKADFATASENFFIAACAGARADLAAEFDALRWPRRAAAAAAGAAAAAAAR